MIESVLVPYSPIYRPHDWPFPQIRSILAAEYRSADSEVTGFNCPSCYTEFAGCSLPYVWMETRANVRSTKSLNEHFLKKRHESLGSNFTGETKDSFLVAVSGQSYVWMIFVGELLSLSNCILKVKLSQCLTTHYTIKAYGGSGRIDLHVFLT
jgi:hypothetical protein